MYALRRGHAHKVATPTEVVAVPIPTTHLHALNVLQQDVPDSLVISPDVGI